MSDKEATRRVAEEFLRFLGCKKSPSHIHKMMELIAQFESSESESVDYDCTCDDED